MNTFKKAALAAATAATLAAAAAAPAHAGWWEKPLVQGLGMGVGMGVGLGVTNAILQPRPQTVYVQQPTCRQVQVVNQFGQPIGVQTIC